MGSPLILTFDCGTQSIRCTLVDKSGNIVSMATERCKPCFALKNGWAEQNADDYAEAFCGVAQKLKTQCGELWNDVIAVTATSVRDTNVCMAEDGGVVRPIIMWLDQREAEFDYKKTVPLKNRFLFRLVGMTETVKMQGKLTKANWIRENEPQNWQKTYKYMTICGYLTHLMTGKFVDSKACQIGHIPYHYKKRRWKSKNDLQFPVFNVDSDKFCPLVEPCEVLGNVTQEFSVRSGIKVGLPVIATGADKGCEALGCGLVDEKVAALSFGTQATVQLVTKKYVEPETFLPAYTSVLPDRYNPEVQIYRGFWMINWFAEQFAQDEVRLAKEKGVSVESLFDSHLKDVPPGADGLLLQPFWAPMLKDPEGRGSIIGFNHVHTKWHVYRAIIEGIGFALYDAFVSLKKRTKNKIERLVASGGGSRSDEVCKITADIFGLPVVRVQTWEATSVGASMAGFVAMHEFEDFDQAVNAMVNVKDVFMPDGKIHETYQKIYNGVYKKLYNSLRPAYKNIKKGY